MKIWNKLLFLAIIVAIFFYLIGSETIVPDFAKKKADLSYLDLFSKVASLVETQYVEPVEADKKYPQAFSAMLDSLDQLSAYLNQNRTRLYNQYQQKACPDNNSVFCSFFRLMGFPPCQWADSLCQERDYTGKINTNQIC